MIWSFPVRYPLYTALTASNGMVYVSCRNALYALRARDGSLAWSYPAGRKYPSSPLVAGETVYALDAAGGLLGLDTTSGRRIWSFTPQGAFVTGPPVAQADRVFLSTLPIPPRQDGDVYALDAESGAVAWRVSIGGAYGSPPALIGGAVLTQDNVGLRALSPAAGASLWTFPGLTGPPVAGPVVSDGLVYVAGSSNESQTQLYALQGSNGALQWTASVAASGPGSLASSQGNIYAAFSGGSATALRAADGALAWMDSLANLDSEVLALRDTVCVAASPTGPGGIMAVGGARGETVLHSLRADNGATRWTVTGSGYSLTSTPTAVHDVIVAGFYEGDVYAVDARDGTRAWTFHALAVSGPIADDGTAYVVAADRIPLEGSVGGHGKVYALRI